MAQAQLIQGTGAELLPYLQQLQHRKNLMSSSQRRTHLSKPLAHRASEIPGLPLETVFRNGVPLFPHREVAQPVTLELVKQLAEDD